MIIKQLQEHGPFNLFVGAGISKLPPAYAPVWREMQMDFLGALFTCMKRENWPAVAESKGELDELGKFNFRPETFWQRILNNTSLSFTCNALKIVNLGKPNLNHKTIAELVKLKIVKNVITTNFDEYLDNEFGHQAKPVINLEDVPNSDDKAILFKVHGTISNPQSLQFTLEHTKKLVEWKSSFLKACLANRPLLIAGYSGYDDDLMPVLSEIVKDLPDVTVVRYPGASREEPIYGLEKLKNVKIIESDISKEIKSWVNEKIHAGSLNSSLLKDEIVSIPKPEEHYLSALTGLVLPTIPLILSDLFELTVDKLTALKYANLADDACEDRRYITSVSKELRYKILRQLSLLESGLGDARMSANFMQQTSQYLTEGVSVSQFTLDQVDRVFEYFQSPVLTEKQIQEIEMYAGGMLRMLDLGVTHGEGGKFRSAWCMGRLRNRQKRHAEAIEYYQMVSTIPNGIDYIQQSCFFLDYGSALLEFSVIDRNDEALTLSLNACTISEQLALRISDHMTAAKAMMNLSQIYLFCDQQENAIKKALHAERLAQLTGDLGLQSRTHTLVEQLKRQLK